ncbi:MAG: hypothetical protein QNJ29_13570 [Rhizobiaceae bacterium]|nr:hypothetical protein [Rhizobiaceae bacterium]
MQSQSISTDKPALLNPASKSENPIVSLFQEVERSDLERDFLELVSETANTAGCQFLFEIPGTLFEKPEYRAAAVVHEYDDLQDHVVFILCNQESGSVEIYDECEVSEQVTKFVGSYANVLTCLQRLETRKQLH